MLCIVAQRVQKADLPALQGEHTVGFIKIGAETLADLLPGDREGNRILLRQEKDAFIFRRSVGISAVWQNKAVNLLRLLGVTHIEEGKLYAAGHAVFIRILPDTEEEIFAHRMQIA